MADKITSFADITSHLREHNIKPENEGSPPDFPDIGQISDEEEIAEINVDDVLRPGNRDGEEWFAPGEVSGELLGEFEEIVFGAGFEAPRRLVPTRSVPPIPAWYCPAHFFGSDGGIYIREDCLRIQMKNIMLFGGGLRSTYRRDPNSLIWSLRSASFLIYFLHEQFHHKIESLGFRMLVAGGLDRYRPYKNNVYRTTFLTNNCLEEALANADSYLRLNEPTYRRTMSPDVYDATRRFLRNEFHHSPPGYRQASNYLSNPKFRKGQRELQSQVFEGRFPASTLPQERWLIAPEMTRALLNLRRSVYTVIPKGRRSIFGPSASPAPSVSSTELITTLKRKYNYQVVKGGKGSHTKLKRTHHPTLIVSNKKRMLSGELNSILKLFGHSINNLDRFLVSR